MGCVRVVFGFLVVSLAIPLLIGFEALTAIRSAFGNREAWYGVVGEPAFYEAFADEVRAGLPMEGAAANLAVAALTPEYVRAQLQKRSITASTSPRGAPSARSKSTSPPRWCPS